MNELGYEPLKEIVIHIGEKGEIVNTDKIRLYVDGVKIKNLRGFKFKAKMGEPPEMTVKRFIYGQSSLDQNGYNNPSPRLVPMHNLGKDTYLVDKVDSSDCKQQ